MDSLTRVENFATKSLKCESLNSKSIKLKGTKDFSGKKLKIKKSDAKNASINSKAKLDLKDLFTKTFVALKKETAFNCFEDLQARYGKFGRGNTPNFLAMPAPILMQRMVR